MKKYIVAMSSFFLGAVAFAQQTTYMCPNNYQYITVGNTMAQVEQACGKPASTQIRRQQVSQEEAVEQWIYQFNAASNNASNTVTPFADIVEYRQGETGPQTRLIIVIKQGKVASLSLSGESLDSASVCPQGSVRVGDSASAVMAICGSPSVVNRGTKKVFTGLKKVTQWTYQFGQFRSGVVLTFGEDGRLVSIQTQ